MFCAKNKRHKGTLSTPREREKALQEEGTMKPTETEEKMTYFYIKTLLLEARRI